MVLLTGNWKREWDSIAAVADVFPYLEGLLALEGYFFRPKTRIKSNVVGYVWFDIDDIHRHERVERGDLILYNLSMRKTLQTDLETSRSKFIRGILLGRIYLDFAPLNKYDEKDIACGFYLTIAEKRKWFEPIPARLSFQELPTSESITELEKKIKESYRRLRTLF